MPRLILVFESRSHEGHGPFAITEASRPYQLAERPGITLRMLLVTAILT